jgi:hypothetical protein
VGLFTGLRFDERIITMNKITRDEYLKALEDEADQIEHRVAMKVHSIEVNISVQS